MADQGYGISIAFQSSFFSAKLLSANWSGIAREALQTTHMTTTDGWRTFMPSDLKDAGELRVRFQFDPNQDPPIDQDAESIVVTYPTPAGQTTPATWTCSGFMTEYSFEGEFEGIMEAEATLKFSGKPTYTNAS